MESRFLFNRQRSDGVTGKWAGVIFFFFYKFSFFPISFYFCSTAVWRSENETNILNFQPYIFSSKVKQRSGDARGTKKRQLFTHTNFTDEVRITVSLFWNAWKVWGHVEITGQLCKRQESFDISGNMRTVLKLWGRFKSHLERSKQFGNCLKSFGVIWKYPDNLETVWKILIIWKYLDNFDTFWTVTLRSAGTPVKWVGVISNFIFFIFFHFV